MQNKILTAIAVLLVGLAVYSVFTDDYGEIDAPASLDHAFYRLGRDIGGGADKVEGGIQDTNQGMQDVANGRMDRNDRKIARDTAGK